MYDIESIITPYADSQPTCNVLPSKVLERIPPLVTTSGINLQFQQFYERIVSAIGEIYTAGDINIDKLYKLSDKSIEPGDFTLLLISRWGEHWDKFKISASSGSSCGIDIELNMDRFQNLHRNLIGGLNIMTYRTDLCEDEFNHNCSIPTIVESHTELLFTYSWDHKFVLLSQISPFIQDE